MKLKKFTAINKALLATLVTGVLMTGCTNAKTQTTDTNVATVEKLDKSAEAALKKSLKESLKVSGFDTEINEITATEMPGIYWINAKGLPAFFSDKSGKFIVQGQIVKIGEKTPVDITAELRQKAAVDALASVDEKDMIIYKPKGKVKGVVYAFTDVDCGYCRKLHSEMKEINDEGIELRYLAWPRSPQTMPAMESIWCAKDRNKAMDTAKSGGTVTPATCENPVQAQIDLGHKLGVTGTPALFTKTGAQVGGYLPAKDLAKAVLNNQ